MAIRLGLTGSIGSGKSTVAAMLARHGAAVIDADALSREAVQPGRPELAQVLAAFGPDLLEEDGQLKRRELAQRVFGDWAATRRLEGIIHPYVRRRERDLLEAYADRWLIVVDVPLLFESGFDREVDLTVTVVISERQRFGRLRARGFTERETIRRLSMQMPQARKAARADYTIDNSGSLEDTREQVRRLVERLRQPGDPIQENKAGDHG